MSGRSKVTLPYSSMVNESSSKREDRFKEEVGYPEVFTNNLTNMDNYEDNQQDG